MQGEVTFIAHLRKTSQLINQSGTNEQATAYLIIESMKKGRTLRFLQESTCVEVELRENSFFVLLGSCY